MVEGTSSSIIWWTTLLAVLVSCAAIISISSEVDSATDSALLSISIEPSEVDPGDTVSVSIDLEGNHGFDALAFVLEYDTDKLTLSSDVSISTSFYTQGLRILGINQVSDGCLVMINYDDGGTGTSNVTGNGNLLNLSFAVNDTVTETAEMSLNLDYDSCVFVDKDNKDLPIAVSNQGFDSITIKRYTAKFVSGEDVVSTFTGIKGTAITAPTGTPSKESTAEFDYKFRSWSGYTQGMMLSSDITFTAVFDEVRREYDVSFISEGEVVSKESLEYGTTIVPPPNPVKQPDSKYASYVFESWKGLEPGMTVVSLHTFNAIFTPGEPQSYKVTFSTAGAPDSVGMPSSIDADYGSSVSVQDKYVAGYNLTVFIEGTQIEGTNFTMPDHDVEVELRYTPIGSEEPDPEPEPDPDPNPNPGGEHGTGGGDTGGGAGDHNPVQPSREEHTITFISNGQTVSTQVIDDGDIIVLPDDPVKESTAQFDYIFIGWDGYTGAMVAHDDHEFVAMFEESIRSYMVSFIHQGEVIWSNSLEYGTVIELDEIPVPEGVSGWQGFSVGMTVTGDLSFNSIVQSENDQSIWYIVAAVIVILAVLLSFFILRHGKR